MEGPLTPDPSAVEAALARIEAELRRLGGWEVPEPPATFSQAFGADVMTFEQWLRHVFVPRVRESVASGVFPGSSEVGVKATREYESVAEADRLVALLRTFDGLFGP